MIDRAALKTKAKAAFKANYWRCVIVALIMAIIIGGGASSSKNSVQNSLGENDMLVQYDLNGNGKLDDDEIRPMLDALVTEYGMKVVSIAFAIIFGAIAGIIAIGSLIDVLLINPLAVGCKNFFLRNSEESVDISELARGFKPAWWNNVVTMFLTDLFTVLWSLLFLFPGIIKAYSYRLVPYIMAENPDLHGTEAITLSRRMMNGHKWEAFVFDLSFLGWYILATVTASIAGVFWVGPYKAAADAELYKAIRDSYSE